MRQRTRCDVVGASVISSQNVDIVLFGYRAWLIALLGGYAEGYGTRFTMLIRFGSVLGADVKSLYNLCISMCMSLCRCRTDGEALIGLSRCVYGSHTMNWNHV